jgi:hypothetical protein
MFIRLHWWKEFRKDGLQNYGDLMSKYLVKKISKKLVFTTRSSYNKYLKKIIKPYYIVIGSVIGAANKNAIVWGSGIISKNQVVNNALFLAVRGPETRKRLLQLNFEVPEIYGDPAILLPKFIKNKTLKKYKLGIIPHFVDYPDVFAKLKLDKSIKVINLLTNDVEKTTQDIFECEQIISSSLHGVIVPHAYQIPALWVRFSNRLSGDDIKFYDYYQSVNINFEKQIDIPIDDLSYELLISILNKSTSLLLPEHSHIINMQNKLMDVCPFK